MSPQEEAGVIRGGGKLQGGRQEEEGGGGPLGTAPLKTTDVGFLATPFTLSKGGIPL